MTLDVQVPTKIVIMGTSSMSLNDRFSKIKPPPKIVAVEKQVVRPSRKSLLASGRLAQSRASLALVNDDYEDGLIDEDMMEEEEVYDPTYAVLRRTRNPAIGGRRVAAMYRPVSIQDRISFAPQPYRTAPFSNNGYTHIANRGRAGFRANYVGGRTQNGFRHNPNYGRLNNGGFHNRFQNNNNRGFPPRYPRGGSRGGFQKKQQPKHTPEELDRELDEYMTKKPAAGNSKHAQITMEGLE